MNDLISRDQVLLTFDMYCEKCYYYGKYYECQKCRFRDARSIIRACPPTATIAMDGTWEFNRETGVSVFHPAVAQGKEGEWIVNGDFIHCSECGYEPPVIDCYDYCNCCGAKMKLPEPLSPSEILYRQASHFVPPTDSGLRQRKEEE